jgi:hypothetical protein
MTVITTGIQDTARRVTELSNRIRLPGLYRGSRVIRGYMGASEI